MPNRTFLRTLVGSLALIAALSLPVAHPATALPKGVAQVTTVEGISEYRLSNGLRVLLFPDNSKQTITVNMTYLVGSRHENYGETGMAHLLEHLVFKGTPRHPNIPKELTERGARPNGTTSFDRTNYFETFAASDDNLRWALDLEADRMVNSFIAKKDLDSEMTVVRNEFEMNENNPAGVLQQRILATAYLWHNYGNLPIGARADIENVSIDRLQQFYRTYYQPDNAILLVAGRFESATALGMIAQYFGPLPKPKRVLPPLYTVEPAQDGERSVALRRVGDTHWLMSAYHIPSAKHPDAAALDLLTTLLSDQPSGRLHKTLVETGKAAQVFAFTTLLYDPGVILLGAQVRKDSSVDAARDALLLAIDDLPSKPFTPEELERARTAELKQVELALNNSENLGLTLSNWMGMGDWRLFFLHRDKLRKATLADVNRVASQYLKSINRTVGIAYATEAPARVEIPTSPPAESLVKSYVGDAAKAEGEAFDPSPANIDARTRRAALPNGLQLALLPKKTRGGTVTANLTLRLGDLQSLTGQRAAAALTGALLMRGTMNRSRAQIKDEFDRLNARVFVSATATNANASVETTRDNLAATLSLLAEVLQKPAFPPGEFAIAKQERLAGIEQQSKEPTPLAQIALQKRIAPYESGDVRGAQTMEELLRDTRNVTLDQVRAFHSEFFGASAGELTIVGDFDDQQIRSLVDKLFGAWNNRRPFTRTPALYFDVPANVDSILTPDKANAYITAGINLKLRDDDADYPALAIANYLFGGGFLNSRLAMRLRQQDGLSYGAGSQLQVSSQDTSGVWSASAIFAPENIDRVEAALRQEFEKLLANGVSDAELGAAIPGWLQSRQVSRAQDAELARNLGRLTYLKRTLAWEAELEKKVAALTAADVNAALRRHLTLDKLSVVKAGDFKKKP